MANLPTDKKLVRVDYTYEDGERYTITGKAVATMQADLREAETMDFVHGGSGYKRINWRRTTDLRS